MEHKTASKVPILLIAACILALAIMSQQPPEDGWLVKGGSTFYILEGQPVTGWQDIGENRYYFGSDGILHTGWLELDAHTYYLDADGIMVTGWLELDGARYYLGRDGIRVTGWNTVDGNEYHFGPDGIMAAGVTEISGAVYLFNEQGHLSHGWVQIGEELYYGDAQGRPVYGWNEIEGNQHYFEESGAAASGWLQLDGFSHYFYTDGAPAQGTLTLDGKLYHFASNGQWVPLVNPWHTVPDGYAVELVPISESHYIAAIAYEDYVDMMADCAAAGFEPAVCSAYRTQEYQEKLYKNRIDRYMRAGYSEERATELAGQSVAVPGTSEHQLGLALDIVDDNNWKLDESQARMPTQKWLMENSWRYGWILRYPNEKSEITGIIYEPWHYRYVGKTVAKEIYESGLCLEEYLEMLTNSVG